MASTSPFGVRKPVSPWTTTSGRPPTAVAMTGTAHAIASSAARPNDSVSDGSRRSEEHTSELQSPCNLVCRLLLEKKKAKERSAATRCVAIPPLTVDLTETHTG